MTRESYDHAMKGLKKEYDRGRMMPSEYYEKADTLLKEHGGRKVTTWVKEATERTGIRHSEVTFVFDGKGAR